MATDYTLDYTMTVPRNLTYLKPEPTDIKVTFSVNSNDLNPLYLQELSEEVRSGYLIPLNDTWKAEWVKWDNALEKKIPNFATKTKGAREKLLTVYVGPLETEYQKQIKNITSMAQTIGERHWQKMSKERSDILGFKLKMGCKVVWKGLKVSLALSTIVASGGAAAMSYVSALKNLHGIYKDMKKVFASAQDYMEKVYGDIEAIRTALFKRKGIAPDNLKALEKATKQINKSLLSKLKNNRETFAVKVKQIHVKAGDISKQLDTALNNIGDALAADPKLKKEHRKKVMDLIQDIEKQVGEKKKFDQFDKTAEKFQKGIEDRIVIETELLKEAWKATKGAAKYTVTQAGQLILATTSDLAAATAASKEGLSVGGILAGWGSKIDTGLKVIGVLGIF